MNKAVFSRKMEELEGAIKARAVEALHDDVGSGDITTEAVLGEDPAVKARVVAHEDMILAGVLEARAVFEDGGVKVSEAMKEGEGVRGGDVILKLWGRASEILRRERTALNFIQKMSGIATVSRRLSKKYPGRILYLRKCDPGLLFSEKRAVVLGGCLPHRIGLFDGYLIKENHLEILSKTGRDGIELAIKRVDEARGDKPIEVETETVEEAIKAANVLKGLKGDRIIMLDNFSLGDAKRAVEGIKKVSKDIIIEASGGMDEEKAGRYLGAGADYVSMSYIVSHSRFMDLSLEFE
jgi:nicotinate-nucleotide pyrophosphorylase (carboxylating)